MRHLLALFVLLAGLAAAPAHAIIVNIDAVGDPTPGNVGEHKDIAVVLQAGTYAVLPVDISTAGALFTAANRFSGVSGCEPNGTLCDTGWEHTYYVKIGAGPRVKYGFGEGISPSPPGTAYFNSAALAFANAVAAPLFTLAAAETVTFSWFDDNWGDNTGGISLSVAAVPEPSSIVLLLASLMVLGAVVRRRTRG
jgi:hypothetical protein